MIAIVAKRSSVNADARHPLVAEGRVAKSHRDACFPDGRSLRASDFRRAFERLFRLDSPAHRCSTASGALRAAGTAGHVRPLGSIVTDDTAQTVTFHLSAPDPDFLLKLTEDEFSAPILAGNPDHAPLAGVGILVDRAGSTTDADEQREGALP